jgi:hypothetical protein
MPRRCATRNDGLFRVCLAHRQVERCCLSGFIAHPSRLHRRSSSAHLYVDLAPDLRIALRTIDAQPGLFTLSVSSNGLPTSGPARLPISGTGRRPKLKPQLGDAQSRASA